MADPSRNADRAKRRQRLLAEFGASALRLIPFDELMQRAVKSVREGVDAGHIKILEHRPNGRMLIVAGVGWKPGVVGHASLPDHMRSPCGHAFQTGKPLIIEDIRAQSEFEWPDILKDHEIISLVNVPIKSQEFTFGVLEVDANEVTHWSEDDIDFLNGFANLLTVAIQRNRTEAQRSTLFREIQHRVKNNLQLIASMMNVRARQARSEEAKQILRDVARRVTAIGSVYELLVADSSVRRLNVRTYLERLCERLRVAAKSDDRVRIDLDVPDVTISMDNAIPLGLITNELVTNSLKHAFPDRGGTVSVSVQLDPDHRGGKLLVADNGVGSPADVAPGFGMSMARLLAQQLRGELVKRAAERGSAFEVR